jgi:ADP-ribose pyrophosphatase YjhB (NUDIX family)
MTSRLKFQYDCLIILYFCFSHHMHAAFPETAQLAMSDHKDLGNAAYASGNFKAAAECYQNGIDAALSTPGSAVSAITTLYSNLAMAQMKLSAPEAALSACNAGLARDTTHEKLRLRRAQALNALGRTQETLSACSDILRDTNVSAAIRSAAKEELTAALGRSGVGAAQGSSGPAPSSVPAASSAAAPTSSPVPGIAPGKIRAVPRATISADSLAGLPAHLLPGGGHAATTGTGVVSGAAAGASSMEAMMAMLKAASQSGGKLSPEQDAQMKTLLGGGARSATGAPAPPSPTAAAAAASVVLPAAPVAATGVEEEVGNEDEEEAASDPVAASAAAAPATAAAADVPVRPTLAGAWGQPRAQKWADIISPGPIAPSAASVAAAAAAAKRRCAAPAPGRFYTPLPADGARAGPAAGTARVLVSLLLVHNGCLLMCDNGPVVAAKGAAAAAKGTETKGALADEDSWQAEPVQPALLGSMAAPAVPTAPVELFAPRAMTDFDRSSSSSFSSDAVEAAEAEAGAKAGATGTECPAPVSARRWYPPSVRVRLGEDLPSAARRALASCRVLPPTLLPSGRVGAPVAAFAPAALEHVSVLALEDYPSLCSPHTFRYLLTGNLTGTLTSTTGGSGAPAHVQPAGLDPAAAAPPALRSAVAAAASSAAVDETAAEGAALSLALSLSQRRPGGNFAWVPLSLITAHGRLNFESLDFLTVLDFVPAISALRDPTAAAVASAAGGAGSGADTPVSPLSPTEAATAATASAATAAARAVGAGVHTGASVAHYSAHAPAHVDADAEAKPHPHHAVQVAYVATHATRGDAEGKLRVPPKVVLVRPRPAASADAATDAGVWQLPKTHVERSESVGFAAQRLSRAAFGLLCSDFACVNVGGGRALEAHEDDEEAVRGFMFTVATHFEVGGEKDVSMAVDDAGAVLEFPAVLQGGSEAWPTVDLNVAEAGVPEHRWATLDQVKDLHAAGELESGAVVHLLEQVLLRAQQASARALETPLGYAPMISTDVIIAKNQREQAEQGAGVEDASDDE